MIHRVRRWPWLTFQMIAANVGIVVMLGYAWYWLFMHQSAAYSERLMATFNIQPGQVHAMFVEEVERQLWTSVTLGLICAVLASIGLTLLIVRPLGALARATDRLRQGDYSVRAQNRTGELGTLADTVNALAAALEQEDGRRAQYLADLGHELRTPITSLRGYTEGLEDGIFAADDSFFQLMSDELNHLTALAHSIEAMELQIEEAGPMAEGVALGDLLEDAQRRWKDKFDRRALQLIVNCDSTLQDRKITLSRKSVRHIVDNLLSNMVRYADVGQPCGISVTSHPGQKVELVFRNGAQSLSDEVLPFLFDRFFRLSHSRTRDRQEHSSGLGLAIVKQLCLANGGSVLATLEDRVLCIHVRLPLST